MMMQSIWGLLENTRKKWKRGNSKETKKAEKVHDKQIWRMTRGKSSSNTDACGERHT